MDFHSLDADVAHLPGSERVPAPAVDGMLALRCSLLGAWPIEYERCEIHHLRRALRDRRALR